MEQIFVAYRNDLENKTAIGIETPMSHHTTNSDEDCSETPMRYYIMFGMFYLNVILIFMCTSLFLFLKKVGVRPTESKSNQTDEEEPIRVVIEPNHEINLMRAVR